MRRLAFVLSIAIALTGCGDDSQPPIVSNPVVGPLGNRGDLPVDDRVTIDHLSAPVDVVRDTWGRPHIYASTVDDALRVEGYYQALDRTLQLEVLRRVSEGRMAELLGNLDPSLIDLDISYRQIGLARVAKAEYDALAPDGELRSMLDAFADGVTQVFTKIRTGEVKLPAPIIAIDLEAFTDWTGVDSLAIGRLQTHLLSFDADADVATQIFFDASRTTFVAGDPDPAIARRAGFEKDVFRFAPADPATTTTGYPVTKPASAHLGGSRKTSKKQAAALADSTRGYLAAMKKARSMLARAGFGSNNWAIAPSRSANGHVMVASDPHLPLSAPAIWWPVSFDVKASDGSGDLRSAGVSFPGIPGMILGHNDFIAWGATVAAYDVSDAYHEDVAADGSGVLYKGKIVPFETVEEIINIRKHSPLKYEVRIVPHHGPILPTITAMHTVEDPDPAKGAISIRWTGLEPTDEFGAVVKLLRARDVDEARAALSTFGVGAQNWMLGDTSGNILWTSHANVPIRDPASFAWNANNYTGTLPCTVLPGDGSAEWKGYLPDDLVPWVKNPAAGYMSTANNDPIGVNLDNDPSNDTLPDGTPMYLGCFFDLGFREGRIQSRIEGHAEPLGVEDVQAIQGDHKSGMGSRLAPSLVRAIDDAERERMLPGAHPDLAAIVANPAYDKDVVAKARALLAGWAKIGYLAESGVDPDTNQPLTAFASPDEVAASQAALIFNAWLERFIARTFADEADKIGVSLNGEIVAKAILHLVEADPQTLATYDPSTQDSAIWDDLATPMVVETREERMVRGLVDALVWLKTNAGADVDRYRWGALHTIRFDALIPLFGALSIPPTSDTTYTHGFPRHGDLFNVDACDFGFVGLSQDLDFSYGAGPSQRFVAELDPAGPKVVNALPGGVVWDDKSPHFRDEADLWKKNATHPIPYALPDVIAAKESRTVVSSP